MAVVATSLQVALVPASYARQKWPHVRFIRLEQAIPADLCVLYAPARRRPAGRGGDPPLHRHNERADEPADRGLMS